MEEHKHITVDQEDENDDSKTPTTEISPISLPDKIEIIRLPTEEDVESEKDIDPRSTFHVYEKHEVHKCISPVVDPLKERRFGPTPKQQKARRIQKKGRQDSGLPPLEPDDTAFFLHQPYLSFHMPPRVLYMGNSKYTAKPAVLIHERCFWREYKLQLGPSISQPGVLDPRGVVAWRHNGGDKKALKANDHKLKGYKVRGWRLWGETGKDYVHTVKVARKTGKGPDPDVLKVEGSTTESPAVAEEVVYLRWSNPFSRYTRRYHFQYLGIDFYWKGTGSVSETRACGLLCRFNHLKLVAKLPLTEGKKDEQVEWCLGKFTNSVACKKNGKLEFFDAEILRLIDEHMPSVLATSSCEEQVNDEVGNERILSMRKSRLYQVFIATAMCMIRSEKEKRHTLLDLIVALAEGGGSGG